MRFLFATLAVALLTSCDGTTEPTEPTQREAPDVPWPEAIIEGSLKSPAGVAGLLDECFLEIDYSGAPAFRYQDKVPDGDDQQPAELCLDWGAHLDVADCVRRGLIELGGVVSL